MTETTAQAGHQDLVITRVFDASPETVFRAWTEPEQFVRWWGPAGFTTPACRIDLRPGGVLHYCMRTAEGQDIWCGGVYREVVPPSLLVHTDYFADPDGRPVSPTEYGFDPDYPAEMLITVRFEDLAGKTKLTLRHNVPRKPGETSGEEQGWNESFERLAVYLEQKKAG